MFCYPNASTGFGIPAKVEDFPAPPAILLTLAHPDEEKNQLCIAKQNYAVDELSKGDAKVVALKKWLREIQDGPFRGEYTGEVWDLNFDPKTDWFKRYLELGGMGGVLKKLGEAESQMETLRNDTLAERALRDSQPDSRLLKTYINPTWKLSKYVSEFKEFCEFWDQTMKEVAKAARDALLTLVTYKHCVKRFKDIVFMC
uniref:Uncharacterized protein n=1 Tax=Cannabis sativa TaxID=3483 RepID=A0A803NRP4_CANSA